LKREILATAEGLLNYNEINGFGQFSALDLTARRKAGEPLLADTEAPTNNPGTQDE
jgi:hypothetical protein